MDSGYLSETELGIIGGSLFFSYAVGKFVNGFFADRFNIRFLMSGGLLVAALLNLILGMHVLFGVFVVLLLLIVGSGISSEVQYMVFGVRAII